MKTDPSLASILIYETDEAGLITLCKTSGNLDTTASKFAVGCMMQDSVSGKTYINIGSVASPSWNSVSDVASGDMDQGLIRSVSINLSAAQINGMYAAPVLVLAGIAGKAIIVDTVQLDLTGTATQFAGGGVANVQYDNTANGAGTTCHADIAAAVFTGATALVKTHRISKDLSAIATSAIDGKGLYFSNKTAAFTTGTGTAVLTVRYHVT
jgi:hypothetical protein